MKTSRLATATALLGLALVLVPCTAALATSPAVSPAIEPTPAGPGPGAGLLITPKRLVFADRDRRGEITLMNHSTEPLTFRLEWIERRMDEAGRLVPYAEGESVRSVDGMVRYSPRQVEVGPGERQTVRVFVRKPADLEAGEYRSHLQLRALPKTEDGPRIDDFASTEDGVMSFRMKALPAISLPIIVRHGELPAAVDLRLKDLKIERETPSLHVQLDRQGERSIYGNVTATWYPGDQGQPITVGRVRGIAIYTTVERRSLALPLNIPPDLELTSGVLRVAFDSRPAMDGGGDRLSAEDVIELR